MLYIFTHSRAVPRSCCTPCDVETGQIWTWGDGHKGELGRVHDPTTKQTPKPITTQIDAEDSNQPKTRMIGLHAFFTKV